MQPTYSPPPQYNPQSYAQPPVYQPAGTVQGAATAKKDPTVALLLELIGYLGFLGIGHIYAGKTTRGIALLIGWWIYLALAWLLTIVLVGCLLLVVALAVPILSGLWIKSEMEKEQALGIQR
jgi:TM2 domain-containing membrane protein YozV